MRKSQFNVDIVSIGVLGPFEFKRRKHHGCGRPERILGEEASGTNSSSVNVTGNLTRYGKEEIPSAKPEVYAAVLLSLREDLAVRCEVSSWVETGGIEEVSSHGPYVLMSKAAEIVVIMDIPDVKDHNAS